MDNARPTPLLEDSEGTRQKLEAWLSDYRNQTVRIPQINIPESTGMSNVTLLFDVEWDEGGQAQRESVVARLQPHTEKTVFPDYDLSLQYEVMDALGRHSDVPVPELRGLETDKQVVGVQFYLMKHTNGLIPTDMPPYNMDGWMMHNTDLQQREHLWRTAVDTMARFHRLDYRALGFSKLEQPDTTPLAQQLRYWRDYYAWALDGERHSTCEPALAWLEENQPAAEPTALCWGDARLGNIIFSESLESVAAVLDWEMAVLGNPLQDIAWFNYMDSTFAEGLGMPRLEGLPAYDDTLAQWSETSGFATTHYNYYIIFAAMRYGLILSRIMWATDQASEVQNNFAVQLLQRKMDELC